MMSLLLTLLAIGAVAYFALRGSGSGAGHPLGSDTAAAGCKQQVAKLMNKTGGLGPDYKTGYEALPSNCRGLLPPPGSLEPSAVRAEPES